MEFKSWNRLAGKRKAQFDVKSGDKCPGKRPLYRFPMVKTQEISGLGVECDGEIGDAWDTPAERAGSKNTVQRNDRSKSKARS